MPDFLKNAACRGHRPQHLVVQRHIPRPALIAKLLRERHVSRFIVAPDGSGKSELALEYADTVFRLEHVFWIDGKSPCFLRDLDDGVIARTLLAEDSDSFLVVIEDVPPLDSERVQRFSDEMDRVLERGCEMLVTCVPTCDAFACHRDRIKLSAVDLQLDNAEIDTMRTPAEREATPASRFLPSRRIAGLVWGAADDKRPFLARALCEELPADVLLPLFVILALQKGSFTDIAAFAQRDGDVARLLAEQYLYLGVDLQCERFDAAPFSLADIAAVCATKMDLISDRSLFPDQDTLALRIADALVMRRQFARACDAVRLLASREARATWLAARGGELFEASGLVPACEVYESLAGAKMPVSGCLEAAEAARRATLGDRAAACTAARRAAGDAAAPVAARIVGALVWSGCAEGADHQRADRLMVKLAETSKAISPQGLSQDAGLDAGSAVAWAAAASVHVALETSCSRGAETWLAWYDQGIRGPALVHAAAQVLRSASKAPRCEERVAFDGAPTRTRLPLERLAAIVRNRMAGFENDTVKLLDAMAGLSFERACERGVVSLPSLDAQTALELRRIEMALFAQRRAWERIERTRVEHKHAFAVTHPDVFRPNILSDKLSNLSTIEPTLTVNLFGGLDVRIGDERVDPALFRRQKVKTLLALLVLEHGREFSRDKLVGVLWPDSDLESARKNFYGIWSSLRRALTTPTGTCPYLIRQQNGLRLDASLLDSDVMRLEEVCRTLLFERPGYGGWAHLFSQINDKFSADLIPSECDNNLIVTRRIDLRDKLVDALVAASSRLVAAGEAQEGLWFARSALQRDRTREDAYVVLMRAQLAAGQRTAALETYFDCRRFLTDELGIDPSIEIMRLYHSIIESEEDFE